MFCSKATLFFTSCQRFISYKLAELLYALVDVVGAYSYAKNDPFEQIQAEQQEIAETMGELHLKDAEAEWFQGTYKAREQVF